MSGRRPGRRAKAAAATAPAAEEQEPAEVPLPAAAAPPEQPDTATLETRGDDAPSAALPDLHASRTLNILELLGPAADDDGDRDAAAGDCPGDDGADSSTCPKLTANLARALASAARRAPALLRGLLPLLLVLGLLAGSLLAQRAASHSSRQLAQLQRQARAAEGKLAALELSLAQLSNLTAAVQGLASLAEHVQGLQQWQRDAAGALDGNARAAEAMRAQLADVKARLQGVTELLGALTPPPSGASTAAAPMPDDAAYAAAPPPATLWQDDDFRAAAISALSKELPSLQPLQPWQLPASVARHSQLPAGLPKALEAYRLLWIITHWAQQQQAFVHPLADHLLLRAPTISCGACLPLAVSPEPSFVDIELGSPAQPVAAVSLHLPAELLDISSAPRQVELIGFNSSASPADPHAAPGGTSAGAGAGAGAAGEPADDEGATAMQHLGTFSVTPSAGRQQHTLRLAQPAAAQYLRLRVLSNHGNPRYTCLYRVAVHAAASAAPR